MNLYPCGRCDKTKERYRAKDNVGTYAHLCEGCMATFPEDTKRHYYDLTDPIIKAAMAVKEFPNEETMRTVYETWNRDRTRH